MITFAVWKCSRGEYEVTTIFDIIYFRNARIESWLKTSCCSMESEVNRLLDDIYWTFEYEKKYFTCTNYISYFPISRYYAQNINACHLTHWSRVTHICVGKLTTIGADNGLSPGRRQAMVWTNAEILLMGPLGTNFIEILIGIHPFSFKKLHLKMSSAKWRLFCIDLSEFTILILDKTY